MSQHIVPVRTNVTIFGILMGLLVLTIMAAYFDLGSFNFVLAMSIAACKAVLILLYFMHVRYSHRLTGVFSAAAFLWLAILLIITVTDYLTRNWLQIPGK
jgi:cytochrome c oxidase subunit IV